MRNMHFVSGGCACYIVAGLLTVLLGGCGQKEPELYSIWEDTTAEEERITLEVFVWDDEETNLQLLADAYSTENPEVGIHLNVIPSTEYSQQMMAIQKGTKVGDCVFFPHLAETAIWIEKGIVQNLEPFCEDIGEVDGFAKWYQEGEEEYSKYMRPYRVSRWAVFYNKDMFDEKGIPYPEDGWTWEDYAQTAVLLTNRVGINKTYGSLGTEPTSIWWRVPARTRGANDPMIPEDLEMFKESVQWCYRLTWELGAQIPYTERTGNQGVNGNEVFLDGQAGMFYCGDWAVAQLNDLIEEKNLKFTYDIAPMPCWEGEERCNISDAAVVTMTANTEYPEEVYDFIRFVTGPEGAAILARRGIIPAWDTEEIRDIFLNSTGGVQHLENFFVEGELSSVPASVAYDEAMEILRDEVASYLLKEQDLEQCFLNVEGALKEIKAQE